MKDYVEEVINRLDSDKVKCDKCKKWFSIKKMMSGKYHDNMVRTTEKTLECYSCFNKRSSADRWNSVWLFQK